MRKIQMIMSKIINVIMIVVVVAILFCLYSVFSIKILHRQYVNVFGYSIFEVVTGSMKNSINVGDAVLVKIDDEFAVGDIVTYKSGDDYITHRVVSEKDGYVVTKGDANNVNDNPIDKSLVLGKVIKIIPELGIWKKVLLTPKVIVLVLLTLFIFSILFSYDGKSIKIIASNKAQKEIDKQIEDEVNKKVALINKRKRFSKKVLDATQIIDISKIKKELADKKTQKELESTQLIETSKINDKLNNNTNNNTKKTLDATQIIDISNLKKELSKKEKKKLDATQVIDISKVKKKISDKKKKLEMTQMIDIKEIKDKKEL